MLYQTVQPDMDPVLIGENQNEFQHFQEQTLPQEYLLYAKKYAHCPITMGHIDTSDF